MSKYTTGELARLCGVSVRTVQYYDTRDLLVPSELSEGGRRLYSEDDLQRMKVICFLRELGLPINSIAELLREDDPSSVISILLEQQEMTLKQELDERQTRLAKLSDLRKALKSISNFSVESLGDIAHIMENKKKLYRTRAILITVGIILDLIEIIIAVYWWRTGNWYPFAIGMTLVVAVGVWISAFYFKRIDYICPKCHKVFKPRFKEAFFALHTPNTRKLTCPICGHRGYCVETCCSANDKT